MALVFSPLGEDTLLEQPRALHPKHAFVMRQLGDPPATDVAMTAMVEEVFRARGYGVKDADASTGAKDFLARILALIRGTGFTVAVFSGQTRPTAMANIALELGFALMCGKPLVIVKSQDAKAPSDLTRTDWIDFDPADEARFRRKLDQALDEIEELAAFTDDLLEIAMAAPAMDCAVAFERASRAFLLTGEVGYLDNIETIAGRLALDARGTGSPTWSGYGTSDDVRAPRSPHPRQRQSRRWPPAPAAWCRCGRVGVLVAERHGKPSRQSRAQSGRPPSA